MNNILWCLIALIFNPFTMTITLYMNGLIWISLDFTARPVMNLNNLSMAVVGLRQVGYVSLVMKNYRRRKWGNKMTEIVDEGIMETTVDGVLYTVFFQDDYYKIKSSDASNEVVVFKKASEVQEFLNRPYKLGDRNAKA